MSPPMNCWNIADWMKCLDSTRNHKKCIWIDDSVTFVGRDWDRNGKRLRNKLWPAADGEMETQSEVKTQLSVGFAFLTALLYWSLILLAYFCNYAGIPWKNSNCREQGPVARVLTAQNWKEPKIGATLHCPSSQQLETLWWILLVIEGSYFLLFQMLQAK